MSYFKFHISDIVWCLSFWLTLLSIVISSPSMLLQIALFHSFLWLSEYSVQFSSVQLLSRVWLFVTPWTAVCQASLSITSSWNPPKPMSIELVMPSNHLILCHPLLLLPSIFPNIRVFSNESALHVRWSKYWSFSFNLSPSNEHPGLISFRMDWLDLLAVQGTLKSLLQHHSSKASILHCIYVSHLLYPFICWRTLWLLPCLSFCKYCCWEYRGTWSFSNYSFVQIYAQEWDDWIIWQLCF